MTLSAVTDADVEHLFTVFRDSDFTWTVDRLPALTSALGWTIAEEIPGKGSIADTSWGIPGADVALLYRGETVESMTMNVTTHAGDDPADRIAVIDVFARIVAIGTSIIGSPTSVIKGKVPRVRWRNERTSVSVKNIGFTVLVVWARTPFQDHSDEVGRI